MLMTQKCQKNSQQNLHYQYDLPRQIPLHWLTITLYRPGPNQWSDPVQFLGGCFRGRPKTTQYTRDIMSRHEKNKFFREGLFVQP